MKVVCIHNNYEPAIGVWTPGKVYNVFHNDYNSSCITTNHDETYFEVGFVNRLDISFKPLRNENLNQLGI